MNAKRILVLAVTLALLASLIPMFAEARDHRHWRHHHLYGWGWYGNPYVSPFYPYPYPSPWYVPPVVINPPVQERVIIQPPPTYIEQPKPQEQQFWYYCPDSRMYHPYAQSCASAWLKVVPHTAPPQ